MTYPKTPQEWIDRLDHRRNEIPSAYSMFIASSWCATEDEMWLEITDVTNSSLSKKVNINDLKIESITFAKDGMPIQWSGLYPNSLFQNKLVWEKAYPIASILHGQRIKLNLFNLREVVDHFLSKHGPDWAIKNGLLDYSCSRFVEIDAFNIYIKIEKLMSD